MFIRNQHDDDDEKKIHVKLFILQGELHGWKNKFLFLTSEKLIFIFK